MKLLQRNIYYLVYTTPKSLYSNLSDLGGVFKLITCYILNGKHIAIILTKQHTQILKLTQNLNKDKFLT